MHLLQINFSNYRLIVRSKKGEKGSGIKLRPINQLSYYHLVYNTQVQCHLCKHPINTSKSAPGVYRYPGKRVIITHLTGVYKQPDFERRRVKNKEKCITGPRSWFER